MSAYMFNDTQLLKAFWIENMYSEFCVRDVKYPTQMSSIMDGASESSNSFRLLELYVLKYP